MALLDLELQLVHVATDDTVTDILVLPVLDIIIPVVLAVQLDGTLPADNLAQGILVGLGDLRQARPVMHLVQILERLGGNALLIIGFGKVEVSFCQAERAFRPYSKI